MDQVQNSFHSVLRSVKVVPDKDKYLVKVDNPILPRIYGPKLTMSSIIKNNNSSAYKLARWLSQKYKSFQKVH